ncbi:MAG TPA: MlaD family protein [Candidatus Binataceae bacterium]|nr:MlaD family protein [Candidatus Binataceae bacterium]
MDKRMSPALVGAFVVGAVAIVVAAITLLGSGRLFRRQHTYVLYFQSSVNGLHVGAPVKFRGVEIGTVTRILLSLNQLEYAVRTNNPSMIRMPVLINLDDKKIVSRGGRNLDLDDPRNLKRLIDAGLRGQLAMESLLTGLLYVELDMFPGTTAHMVLPSNSSFQEIPTRAAELEQLQQGLAKIVAKLSQVDFPKAVASVVAMTDAIRNLADSPKVQDTLDRLETAAQSFNTAAESAQRMADAVRAQVGPLSQSIRGASDSAAETMRQARTALADAQRAFDTAQSTFAEVKTMLDPASPITYQLNKTLEDISGAARSTRELADFLERNPSSLIRGRAASQDGR